MRDRVLKDGNFDKAASLAASSGCGRSATASSPSSGGAVTFSFLSGTTENGTAVFGVFIVPKRILSDFTMNLTAEDTEEAWAKHSQFVLAAKTKAV